MNKLLVVCLVGVALCVSLLTKDIVAYFKTKQMVKRSLEKCFKAAKEKDVK